jgi:hypothetical protein
MGWAVAVTAVIGVLGTVAGSLIAYRAATKTTERQIQAQAERESAAAGREYARRADDHFRPYFDEIMVAARRIHNACRDDSADIGDINALDACIDHLESSALTRPVAAAGIDLRRAALDYVSQLGLRTVIADQMPAQGSGAPLNEDAGNRLVDHVQNELQPAKDRLFVAVQATFDAVKAAVAQLVAMQDSST